MSQRHDMTFAIHFTDVMAKWVKQNRALNRALPPGKWLFEMFCKRNDRFIKVNLRDLSYPYYAKFIEPDPEAYCLQLLRAIEPKVFNLISCEIEPFSIRYEFMTHECILIKNVRYSFVSMVYDRGDNDSVVMIRR